MWKLLDLIDVLFTWCGCRHFLGESWRETVLECRRTKGEDALSDAQKLVRKLFTKKKAEEMEALLRRYSAREARND